MRLSPGPPLYATLFGALLVWAAVCAWAWDTWYLMNHATGTVAALADAALHGEVAGREGGSLYLGSLYSPPFPLLVAALRNAGSSWLHALRGASLVSAVLVLAAIAAACRAAGAGRPGIAVALALAVACNPFKVAALGGRADLLATACTVAAIAAWLRDRELRGWAAPVLAAAAWLCKMSEVAAPLAVVAACALAREVRPLARFVPRFALAVAAGVAALLPFGGPAWYAQALANTLAPPNTSNLLRGPAEVLRYMGSYAELTVLAALAIAALVAPAMRRSPLRPATGAALVLALLVLANFGSHHNHLLTTLALAAVCGGAAWESMPAKALALVAVLVVVPAASWRDTQAQLRHSSAPAERREALLETVRAEPGPVLAEDPLLLLAAGRRSPITDPATLRSRARAGDERARAVIRATEEARWSLIVLDQDADRYAAWYRDYHFGDAFGQAVRTRYRREAEQDYFFLYRRNGAPPASP